MFNAHLFVARRVMPLAIFWGMTGCASWRTAPQLPAAPVPPAAWQEHHANEGGTPERVADAWWQTLGDPELDAMQAQALQTNVETLRKAVSWQIAMNQAELTATSEYPKPSLDLRRSASRSMGSTSPSGLPGVSSPSQTFSSTFGLSYEWDLWAKLSQASQADRSQAGIRYEDWRMARWLVSTKVAEAYWSIAAIDLKLPMLTELLSASDEAVRIAQLKLAEGKLRAYDVDTVITRQFEARQALADAQSDRRIKLQALSMLLDREPGSLSAGAPRLPDQTPAKAALQSPAHVLERRPDVRQARLAVDAALARLHVAEASRYPSLVLPLSVGTNTQSWRDWFSQPLATLGLNLAVPLVDWRRLDAQRDMARNTLDDAALGLRATVRQALVEVESALIEHDRWQRQWDAAQVQLTEKDKVYTVSRLRYKVGVVGRLDVLQSRHDVLTSQMTMVDLRLKAWLNRLTLYKALGGPG